MRGLFLKIFAIFWLAQSLIFIISTTLIVGQRFPSPNTLSDALDSNLQHDANVAFAAFQAAGCPAFADNTQRHEPSGAALLDAQGNLLCATPTSGSLKGLVPHFPDRIDGRLVGTHYLWLVPVGGKYEYVWFQPPSSNHRPPHRRDLLHFAFPQLPVAIAIGGLTTFILVLLFTRPLVRLRRAARSLAAGDLSARVEDPPPTKPTNDEFQGLIHDFNHMAERLESLVGAQKLLLRDVSHELRSPLARLSVALELAREDAPPETGKHLGRIEREAERLNQLIGQLLTLSSMEALETNRTFEPVSLNRLCEQILPDAEYEAQRRPCAVTLLQESEVTIRGDYQLLYRAIENVIRNAIRYTEPHQTVTLRVAEATLEGITHPILEIADQGPGIPESELEHIFRPFYRVDQARSSSTGGFGVGLAITERAMRLHGGTIHAANRPTGGTAITFLFPPNKES